MTLSSWLIQSRRAEEEHRRVLEQLRADGYTIVGDMAYKEEEKEPCTTPLS